MPSYKVTIQRVEYHRAEIEVEAESVEEAKELALDDVSIDDYECTNAEETVESVKPVSND